MYCHADCAIWATGQSNQYTLIFDCWDFITSAIHKRLTIRIKVCFDTTSLISLQIVNIFFIEYYYFLRNAKSKRLNLYAMFIREIISWLLDKDFVVGLFWWYSYHSDGSDSPGPFQLLIKSFLIEFEKICNQSYRSHEK